MARRRTADEKIKIIPALAGKLPARCADLAFQDDTKDARAFYANNEALMGKKKAVFLTAMADEDQKTASGANASFDLMADYLGWEIVGRLNVGGCSTADDLHEEGLTAAYELGKNL